ncbi:MAG TPA: cupin domain-containing protein [Spirochaetota bacterium]|nr:cupin domain-containing protein [Spirochaetota bacterium]HQP47211.1 cupin domain-containing protein [Spirochaetota bacterium]
MPESDIKVGEKIKELREMKGMTLQDIADKTGFSTAFISQIENHLISPPLGALIKLSHAMNLEIGKFFKQEGTSPYTIVRKNERVATSRVASKEGVRYGYSYESLAPDKINRSMEPFLVTLEPMERKGAPYSHEGEEFIFVLEGRIEVQLDTYTDVLEAGDSIYYDSTVPHRVSCLDEVPAKILAVIYAS